MASISVAKSVLRTTALTSSFLKKLHKSIFVDPTVDQTPSITAVLAWRMVPPSSYNLPLSDNASGLTPADQTQEAYDDEIDCNNEIE